MRLPRAARVGLNIVRRGVLRGRCPVCGKSTAFYLRGKWIRDDLRCVRCDSCPRQRALVEVLNREYPEFRSATIHESSPSSPTLEMFRRECKSYLASHYLPDVPRGTSRNGFQSESLEELTFPNESLDLTITQDVLEHIPEPKKAFAEIARTLKPGGAHVFTVPWFYSRATLVRARKGSDGSIEHLQPPDYHGNPLGGGSLVITEWGRDLPDFIESCSGLKTQVVRLDDASLGITGAFVEVFVSRK